jgi:hypothetical protein
MKRVTALKILNPLLILLALDQIINTFVMKLSPSMTVLTIHEWTGYALGIVVLLHFILNWNWIKMTFLTPKKKTTPTA